MIIRTIRATAGYGKTTLIMKDIDFYAQKLKGTENDRSLYITYTKHNVQDARKKIGRVLLKDLIRTLHSVCYEALSLRKNDDEEFIAELRSYDFNKQFSRNISPVQGSALTIGLQAQLRTRDDFLLSMYNKIRNLNANPEEDVYIIKEDLELKNVSLDDYFKFVKDWELFKRIYNLIDFNDMLQLVDVEHFKYLFNRPDNENKKNHFKNVVYFFFDEFQDFTPLMLSVVEKLIRAREDMLREVVLVGDESQTIYNFQGAEPLSLTIYAETLARKFNAEFKEQVYSESKRCPDNILFYAKLFSKKEIKGNEKQGTLIENANLNDFIDAVKRKKGSAMIIVRHNADVKKYIEMLDKMQLPALSIEDYYKDYKLLKLISNINRFKEKAENELYEIYKFECELINHKPLDKKKVNTGKLFFRYNDLKYAMQVIYLYLMKKNKKEKAEIIKRMYNLSIYEPVVVLTAHKSKGLEADIVYCDLAYDETIDK
ncbi:UvrD-helicase domain-containing protein, partial [Venenivibrio stagnispumantis]